jgi:hypothetical protein
MPKTWGQPYKQLTNYILEHHGIEFGDRVTSIPSEVRPLFYEHFNDVRDALIRERISLLLDFGTELSQNYLQLETILIDSLELESINMDVSVHRFLHNPSHELRRGIFDPLFELLKGKIKNEQFEHQAVQSTLNHCRPLFQCGYEKWVVLALTKLIEAERLYEVRVRSFSSSEEQTRMGDGTSEENIPPIKESRRIFFNNGKDVIFTIPDFIIYSSKVNKYVGIRSKYGKALAKAREVSEKRKWYTLDSITPLDANITLVYIDDDPDDIALVSDFNRICKPDIIIITKELDKWYEKEGLSLVRPYHYSLKPKMGTYVVSRETVGKLKREDQEGGIHVISAGYEIANMLPILNSITDGINDS